ncbi:type III-B CRISPR module RAMP protein Cmr1 [Saccharibacillus sp. CPCC 101409]|uniref:type III-B CRISPR module RAMP protein Cmr1 n=1 Tax=Saccharibacillus sp. CPCC 101409 TaxID=3058041 RepID=UPI0026716FC0|nr:type III-B CRISPR module RAMP protein Cmr1 [Saccharibacillus sp. CPCC 101409]MDO3411200.1 type III-B CRISPR module RAMP protein Cmr1 [Saccharibacillus sp. CPCC 101409]
MRTLSKPNPDMLKSLEVDHAAVEKYPITLVTPMFGGGAKAGEVDGETPIRASAIRGQLRFWWRATRGAKFDTTYELRKRETEIFGDTERPSPVKVWVSGEKVNLKRRMSFPKYALYSAGDEMEKAKKQAEYTVGYTFELHIEYKDASLKSEIEAALWAWINFGGIGSRTRRGCGSLYCPDFSPQKAEVVANRFPNWFDRKVKDYDLKLLPAGESREWPTLSNRFKVRSQQGQVKQNWDEAIEAYRVFRRRANDGKQPNRPGRSHWPEADSIRTITRMKHPKHHKRYPHNKPANLIAFPRAEFGLPIIFEFKQKFDEDKNIPIAELRKRQWFEKEPYKTQLLPAGKDRLASPVILKPLAYGRQDAIGLIILLNQPPLKKLELQRVGRTDKWSYGEKEIHPKIHYDNNPMVDRNGTLRNSAIEAFLNSEEVERFCQSTNLNKR